MTATVSDDEKITLVVTHKSSAVHGPAVMDISHVPELNAAVLDFIRNVRPKIPSCSGTTVTTSGHLINLNDLLFVSTNGKVVRPRDYVRKAFQRALGRSYNPGDVRILTRMLLSTHIQSMQQQPFGESTAQIVASAFGHSVEV